MAKSNENIDTDSITAGEQNPPQTSGSFDPQLDDRATELLNLFVAQMRAAIQLAGRFALSLTAGAVPPESVRYILNAVAFQLTSSKPDLQYVILTEKGVYAPLQVLYKEAMAYIQKVQEGAPVIPPSDPTGMDYLTAIDQNNNPPVTSIMSAPMIGEIDYSTDNALGGKTYTGTNPPNNNQCGVIGDIYEQTDANGVTVKLWEKTSGYGTTTGWE